MTPNPAEDRAERLDKWLWQARFFKSRSIAAKAIQERRVRVNQAVVTKTHHKVRRGDVLTFAQGANVRVIEVQDCATTRGPAVVARLLYTDLLADGPKPKERAAAGEAWAAV
ncbi:MAG: RNA-binding S4 domain-containing protein [Geminicoccaceae bacterium]|nr:MAG: RNA-binding S4 domain-containing protein [Geminicoccaceae bacterium]